MGILRNGRCRSTVPVEVMESVLAEQLKEAAVQKHRLCHSQIQEGVTYKLLFKDHTAVRHTTGCDEPFRLDAYKKATLWHYSEMRFYIAPDGT